MSDLLSIEDMRQMQKDIAKSMGGDLYWGNDDNLALRKLSLGIPTLDHALDGGFAFDRITLLYGEYSAGKTLVAMLAMKRAIEQGLSVAFIDVEKTWTRDWALAVGVDPEQVIVTRPRTGEEAFNQAVGFVRARVGVVVFDSLAAIQASARLDTELSEMHQKQFVGLTPRLINEGLKDIQAENKGSLVIVINQLRENIGGYGNPESLPGGKGQNFYAWQRVRVKRDGWIEEGTGAKKKRIGFNLKITVEKNKQGSPYKSAQVPFYFTGELDELAGMIDFAVESGIIRSQTPHYFLVTPEGEEIKIFGRPKLIETIKGDESIQEFLKERIANIEELEL